MFGREEIANTYLGNGICIPHGLQENREMILNTGVAVVQFPQGVEWKDGQIAHIVVGIAAKTDEHIQILSKLTDLLSEEEKAKELAITTNVNDILNALNQEVTQRNQSKETLEVFSTQIEVTFPGYAGFHARPATHFVDVASTFSSEIRLSFNGKTANGKSMANILRLGITGGSNFIISAKGEDEKEAIKKLEKMVCEELDEKPSQEIPKAISKREYTGKLFEGVPASPGIAIAPIVVIKEESINITAIAEDLYTEKEKLKNAIHSAITELNEWIRARHEKPDDQENMEIFTAHLGLLKDPELQEKAFSSLKENSSAAKTWWDVITSEANVIANLSDARLAQRATDIKDIGKRVLKFLDANAIKENNLKLEEPAILITLDMTPSQTALLDKEKVLALITVKGGSTSHTAILARSMGIPSIAGVHESILQVSSQLAIVDGDSGILISEPTKKDLELAEELQIQASAKKEEEFKTRFQPAVTTDGIRMEIVANIADEQGAKTAVENGAEGVGLLRTEFLFLKRDTAPNETEQFQTYKKAVQHLNGLPLIIRTLDIGGDKEVPYLNMPKEDNPFLGIRGIRLCLNYPELFKEQLRAIYQASKYGPVKIMFPMVGLLEEFRDASKIAEEIRLEVGAEPIDIGMMIEVPSAVMLAEHFAKEAAFFSIGTNDLTQYVLSMDRGHEGLAKQADALHPAVLRMIDLTCQAAKKNGKWVGVCGNLAANPLAAKILTGLGVAELSVTTAAVANIKSVIRNTNMQECKDLAQKALSFATAKEVRSLANSK